MKLIMKGLLSESAQTYTQHTLRFAARHLNVRSRPQTQILWPKIIVIRGSCNVIIIIIDNFCIALFSGVHKLTALYNILQHLGFTKVIHIIMTINNV